MYKVNNNYNYLVTILMRILSYSLSLMRKKVKDITSQIHTAAYSCGTIYPAKNGPLELVAHIVNNYQLLRFYATKKYRLTSVCLFVYLGGTDDITRD